MTPGHCQLEGDWRMLAHWHPQQISNIFPGNPRAFVFDRIPTWQDFLVMDRPVRNGHLSAETSRRSFIHYLNSETNAIETTEIGFDNGQYYVRYRDQFQNEQTQYFDAVYEQSDQGSWGESDAFRNWYSQYKP